MRSVKSFTCHNIVKQDSLIPFEQGNEPVTTSTAKSIASVALALLLCLLAGLAMAIARATGSSLSKSIPLIFHRIVSSLFGLQIQIKGKVCEERSMMYVSNHVSYLDIFVLGSTLKGFFVAKSEVSSWPVFGKLAALQNTVFIERRGQKAKQHVDKLKSVLASSNSLILFPEGTTTRGDRVAKFRSSLFAAAEERWIQPITIAYVKHGQNFMSHSERGAYAWYVPNPQRAPDTPNQTFARHFYEGLGRLRKCQVELVFHEPIYVAKGERKAAALQCEATVRGGLTRALELGMQHNMPSEADELRGSLV